MNAYLDNAATTQVDPEVRDVVLHYMEEEYGNAGSRTHSFGSRAKQAVQMAREEIAAALDCDADEVCFTSGATESNNIAILGIAPFGVEQSRKHIVSTQIEHKAVLEPLEQLELQGFEIDLIPPCSDGMIIADEVLSNIRRDTLMVSMMHVNNETGVEQPVEEVAQGLLSHEAILHVDAAQSFGKRNLPLTNPRIDLLSISGHKIHAPKGVGALITRKRKYRRPPLRPLMFGGGQERGLRPGTLPVPLIVGLGKATALASRDSEKRENHIRGLRESALEALQVHNPILIGDQSRALPNILAISIPKLDSEGFIVATKDLVSVSNGSACTSASYSPSHVLTAMGCGESILSSALRLSWSHLSTEADWASVRTRLSRLT